MFAEDTRQLFQEVIAEAKALARDVKDGVTKSLTHVFEGFSEQGEKVVSVKRESILDFLFDEALQDLKRIVGEKLFYELRDILDTIDWCVNVNYVIFRDTQNGVVCDVVNGFQFLSEDLKSRIEKLKEKLKSLHLIVNL